MNSFTGTNNCEHLDLYRDRTLNWKCSGCFKYFRPTQWVEIKDAEVMTKPVRNLFQRFMMASKLY